MLRWILNFGEQYRYPGLTIKNTLHGVHVVDVTCIDYRSDGEYIITGDESQIDLPPKQKSGLIEARKKLEKLDSISFIYLDEKDVIRHKLVKQIIKAYKN